MKDEFETTMRMMGCTELSQLNPGLLNLCDVKHWVSDLEEQGPPKLSKLSLRSRL
jgi:L-lactate dehydrogenase (cytochrome)